MQFTKAEDYGMIGAMHLAEKNRTEITPLSEISEAEDIPEKFLAKIFQSLTKMGIVRSHRGVRGGYTLARDPAKVTVKEVLEAIQGPYHLMKCLHDTRACDKGSFCALRDILIIAERRLVSTFEEYTLADLTRRQKGKRVRA